MKIEQLLGDLSEARRNNYGREQSHKAGQELGKHIASGLPSADTTAAIQANKELSKQDQAAQDLQLRLGKFKAAKAASAPTTTPPTTAAPDTPTETDPSEIARLAGVQPGGAGAFSQMGQQLAPPGAPTTPTAGDTTVRNTATPAATSSSNDTTTPGSSSTTPTTTTAAPSTGSKVANFGRKAAGMAGGFIRGLGNVAGELGNAAGQAVTAPIGGAIRGYQTARQGVPFTGATGSTGSSQPGYAGGAGSNVSPGGLPDVSSSQVARDEIADLKQTIANIGQRLNRAGIAEKKIN